MQTNTLPDFQTESTYRVTWIIDITASSEREAAEQALEIQRDPDSIALEFEVRRQAAQGQPTSLRPTHVDLWTPQAVTQATATGDETPGDGTPAFVRSIATLWGAIRDQVDTSHGAMQAMNDDWAFYVDASSLKLADLLWPGHQRGDALRTIARSLTRALCREACVLFGPAGAPLSIDAEELVIKHPVDVQQYAPVDIWRHLAARYGNGKGHTAAYHQAAQAIHECLSRRCDPAPTVSATTVTHRIQVVLDDMNDKYGQGIKYSTYTRERMEKLLTVGLPSFITAAGAERSNEVCQALAAYAQRYSTRSHFHSHEKVQAGPFTFVHHKSSIRLSMPSAISERLGLFVATHYAKQQD